MVDGETAVVTPAPEVVQEAAVVESPEDTARELDGVATEEQEAQIESLDTETEDESDDLQEQEEAETEEEVDVFDSFDLGGNPLEFKKGEIPEEVADKVKDFTKSIYRNYAEKMQGIAEQNKALVAREEAFGKLQNMQDTVLSEYSKGLQLQNEIQQLSQVDMQSLWQSNPDRARQLSDQLSAKQAEFNRTLQTVDQMERQVEQATKQEMVRRAEEGKAILDKRIKGFSQEKAKDVVEYAVKNGIPESDAQNWALNPTVTQMAYKAMLYDRMQQTTKDAVAKPAPKATVKPMKGMKSTGKTQVSNPSDMSFGQLAKHLGIKK